MPTAGKLDTMQDGVLVKSLRQSLQQSFANSRKSRYNAGWHLRQIIKTNIQQSFANSRNNRYNAGWCFSLFVKTKLTAIICQQQKY